MLLLVLQMLWNFLFDLEFVLPQLPWSLTLMSISIGDVMLRDFQQIPDYHYISLPQGQ